MVSHNFALFGDQYKCRSKYLFCHINSLNHVIEGSFIFIIGGSWLYVTTLPSLLPIGTVIIEI